MHSTNKKRGKTTRSSQHPPEQILPKFYQGPLNRQLDHQNSKSNLTSSSIKAARTNQTKLTYKPNDRPSQHNYQKLQNFVLLTGGKNKVTGYKRPVASLNIKTRVDNIRKIVEENKMTYKKLSNVKSDVDFNKMREHIQQHRKIRQMIKNHSQMSIRGQSPQQVRLVT